MRMARAGRCDWSQARSGAPRASSPASAVSRNLSRLASVAVVAGTTADSGATRSEIWTNALRLIRDYPLTGAGLGSFPTVSRANYAFNWVPPDYPFIHSHNIFLQVGVDFGLPGLIAFLALLLVLAICSLRLSSALRGQPASLLAAGLGGSLVVCVVAGLGDDSALPFGVKSGFLFWIAAGAIAGAWRSTRAATNSRPLVAGRLSGQRRLWAGAALITAAIVALAGPAILAGVQVNRASLALDHVFLQPTENSAAKRDSLVSIVPLLQNNSRLTGSWQTVRLGRAYLALGESAAALATWRQAPLQSVAYLNSQGDACWGRRDLAAAESFYRLSLQVASDPQTQYRLARVLEGGRETEAMALYEQALAQAGAGLDSTSRADARLRMGRLLARRSDWSSAIEQYDRGLARIPFSGELIAAKADALARWVGNNEAAEAILEQASAGLTGSLALYKTLVAMYLQDGQTENARDLAQKALRAVPGSAWPHILMGQVLLAQGEAADAVRFFRRADMMRLDLADPHLGLATAYAQLGNGSRALAESQKAALIEPYKPEVQASVGEILRSLGKADLARQAYQRALTLDGKNEQARRGLLFLAGTAAAIP